MNGKSKLVIWSQALVCVMFAITSVVYASEPLPNITAGSDPTLVWMQAAGFPAWAAVVAWGVMKVTQEIKNITDKLDLAISDLRKISTDLDKRLSRVEIRMDVANNRLDGASKALDNAI